MTLCRAEIRTYYLPDNERMRNVLCKSRGYAMYCREFNFHVAQKNNQIIIQETKDCGEGQLTSLKVHLEVYTHGCLEVLAVKLIYFFVYSSKKSKKKSSLMPVCLKIKISVTAEPRLVLLFRKYAYWSCGGFKLYLEGMVHPQPFTPK